MANPVANIQIGVNLIDDYLYLEESPVQQDLSGRFITVHNPSSKSSTSELLTVNGEGQLVHFMADPASNSGWDTTVVTKCAPPAYGKATSDTISRLAAFYDGSSILNVLAYYPTGTTGVSCATWMQRSTDGAWTVATGIMSGTTQDALAETYQTDVYVDVNGNGYFYGVSGLVGGGAFFIATYNADKNAIDVIYSYPLSDFPPAPDGLAKQAAFRMAPSSSDEDVTILWVNTPANGGDTAIYYQGATITIGRAQTTFAWSNGNTLQPSEFQPNLGTLSVSDIVCLPGDFGADALLLRDGEDGLWLVQGYNAGAPTMTALSGDAATQPVGALSVAAGYDSTGAMTLFAIESGGTDNLWYAQQVSPTATLDPTGWVNLGGEHFAIGSPPSMVAGPELFSAEFGASGPTVYHMDRSLSNPVWSTRKVAAPLPTSGPPTNIASYTMELTTLDTYGNIVPSTGLQVTTDQAATVIWNLVAYHVGPNTPIPVQTDANGQASVQLQCDSLKPPVVTFSATVGQSIVSRWCQGDVVEVKTNEEALPPLSDSVAPTLQTVDGQTLIETSLFNPSGYSESQAQTAAANTAQAINATGSWMSGNPGDPSAQGMIDTTKIKTPHWQLDFTHPEGPHFRVLSLEEAREIVRRSRDGSTPPLLGGSLGSVFGDVAHFFKKEWAMLHSFSSSLENDVLTVTLEAEEGTQSFVISTVKEAGAALETVFAKIKQIAGDIYGVIAEVVAWLKMLFEWDDILNTQKAINACVTQTILNIEASVKNNDAQAAVNKWISELKADIAGYFAQLEDVFDSQTSYNSYANAAGQPSTSALLGARGFSAAKGLSYTTNILAATPTQNAHRQHASKCNYVYSKTKTHYANSTSTAALVGAPAADSGVQPIIDAVLNNICGDAFNNAVATINTQLQTLGSNPGAIFDMIIIDILTAAQAAIDVILDGMEAVLDAVIQVATDATVGVFEALDAFLQTPITIPVVSWLWTNVIDPKQPFNMLNLISLIGAVITTILYKVLQIDGGNPPFSSDVSGEITGNLPWPALPGSTPAEAALSSTALAGAGLADASGMMPLRGMPPMEPVPPMGGAPGHGTPWGSAPPAWSTPLAYVGAGLMFLNGLVAAETDLYAYDNAVIQEETKAPPPPNPAFQFWSVVSLVFGVMIAGSGAPYKAIYDEPKTGTDGVTIAYWGSNIVRLVVDIIFTLCGPQMCKVEGCPTWGPQCKTALGCLSLALAVTTAVVSKVENNYSPWATANMVIRPISPVAKFLLMGTNSTAVMFLMLLEAFLGIGAGVTQAEKTGNS